MNLDCQGAVVQFEVPPLYWLSFTVFSPTTSWCEQVCTQGGDPLTHTISRAPSHCGSALLHVLECMNITARCGDADAGEPGAVAFDCTGEAAQLTECGPVCDALPNCSQQSCSGVSYTGDVGCQHHCGGYEDLFCVTGTTACAN
jgi:hypothetical protein